jgi:hypothetical protein
MDRFQQYSQCHKQHWSGKQFHENLEEKLAGGAEYITARSRWFCSSSDCGKNPKKTAQMTANNYRPLVQGLKTPKSTISSSSECSMRIYIEYSAHDNPRIP